MKEKKLVVRRISDDFIQWPSYEVFKQQGLELQSFLPVSPLSLDICMLILFTIQKVSNESESRKLLIPDLTDPQKALLFLKETLVEGTPEWTKIIITHFEKNIGDEAVKGDITMVTRDFMSWSRES